MLVRLCELKQTMNAACNHMDMGRLYRCWDRLKGQQQMELQDAEDADISSGPSCMLPMASLLSPIGAPLCKAAMSDRARRSPGSLWLCIRLAVDQTWVI